MKVESHKVGIHSSSDNLKGADKSLIRRLFSILYDLSRESRVNAIRNPDGGRKVFIKINFGQFLKSHENFIFYIKNLNSFAEICKIIEFSKISLEVLVN